MTTEETVGTASGAPPQSRHLEKSAVAVLGNTVATGALGTAFWLLAARLFDDGTVGAVVAASSLLIALSFVAQLNLATAFSRFLPTAGADQRHIVQSSYRIALVGAAAAAAVTVLIGLARGGSIIDGGDLSLTIVTAASIPVWVVFALQDGALVAVRRAHWLPIENGITSVAKLALLPLMLLVPGDAGILLAWTLPAVPAILIINRALFGGLLQSGSTEPVPVRPMVKYASSDLAGAMATMLSLRLVPIVVVEVIGAERAAYVGVPWSILTVAALALTAISRLMLSEMSHDAERAEQVARRTTRFVLWLFVPGAIVGALLANPLLRLASPEYASEGTWVLALGIIGLVPAAIAECRMARVRFVGDMVEVSRKQIMRAVTLLIGVVAVLVADRPELIGLVFALASAASLIYIRPQPLVGAPPAAASFDPTTDLARADAVDLGEDRAAVRRRFERRDRAPAVARAAAAEHSDDDDGPPPLVGGWWTDDGLRLLARHWGAFIVGIPMAVFGMARADIDDVDGLGWFSALPAAFFLGVALILVSLVAAVVRDDHRAAWVHLTTAVVVLHGLPGFVSPHPRFAVAWLHVGFADQIAADGELLPLVDARFSWPGFFTTAAFLQRIAGTDSTLWLVRFAPIVINLAAIVALWNLARVLKASRRQANLAAGIFVIANWIGQDYFAPQAVGFVIATTLVAIVLKAFPADPSRQRWVRRLLAPPAVTDVGVSGATAVAVYLGVAITMGALVITHQLTPVLLGFALTGLGLLGRISPRLLGPLLLVGVGTWLAFGAEAYWLGHLDKLTGSVGDVGGVVGANVSERSGGSSPERSLLLRIRLVMMGSVWLFASVVLVVRRFRRTLDPAFVALFFGPFLMVAAQPYGGELLLRVALITLPVSSILIATTVLAARPARSVLRERLTLVGLSAAFVVALPLFVLARFGNESFEYITSNDLAVTETLYEVAPEETVVYVQNRQTLVSIDRVDEVRFRTLSRRDETADIVQRLRNESSASRGVYVLLTETQANEARESRSLPADWILDFADELLTYPGIDEVTRVGGAVLLEVHEVPASERGS